MSPAFDLATGEAPFFEPLISQKFVAHFTEASDTAPLDLELVHVSSLPHHPAMGGRAPFSLLFKTPDLSRVAQGTYEMDGPGLNHMPIFLVPVRDPERGVCMEATFH